MKKNYRIIFVLLLVFLIVAVLYLFFISKSVTKIAYIRSNYLVENYEGMKETQKLLESKVNTWDKQVDTLINICVSKKAYIDKNKATLTKIQVSSLQDEIDLRKTQIAKIQDEVEKLKESNGNDLIQGSLNQINSFLKTYAKEHQIDLIIGVNQSGNLLYGNENLDITEDVLIELNKSFAK